MRSRCFRVGHQDQFHQEFGDAFVLGIQQGGVFHAVLEFKTTTQEELQDLSASITAGELGLFESEAKFSSKMTDLKKTKNLKDRQIDSFQQGGKDQKVKIDIDGIIERAVNFPAQVKVAAEPYFAVLMDYTAIDMPAPLNEVKIENAKMVIQSAQLRLLSSSQASSLRHLTGRQVKIDRSHQDTYLSHK